MLLRLANLQEDISENVQSFLQKRKNQPALMIIESLSAFSKKDVFVALDVSKIVGLAVLIRVTPKNAAIGCFMLSRTNLINDASELLVQASVNRARETGHTLISCIPGHDNQPSASTLTKFGFQEIESRTTFFGKAHSSAGVKAREIRDSNEALKIISRYCSSVRTITVCFRPSVLNVATLDHFLSHGCLLFHEETLTHGVALASETKYIRQDNSPLYLVPEYVAERIPAKMIGKAGEIAILALDQSSKILDAAINWLHERGIENLNVYTTNDREIGMKLMGYGVHPRGSHSIWTKDLTGPMDSFVSE